MRVIDARTGKEIKVGETIRWDEDETMILRDIDEGLFSATATVDRTYRDFQTKKLVARRSEQIPLEVRFTHPRFFLQKVAFIPS